MPLYQFRKKKDDCSQSVQSVGEQIIILVPWSSVISLKKKDEKREFIQPQVNYFEKYVKIKLFPDVKSI